MHPAVRLRWLKYESTTHSQTWKLNKTIHLLTIQL